MLVLAAAVILLVAGSVLVFIAFDAHSHSVSDTVRPFVITMLPIWAAFALVFWVAREATLRRREESADEADRARDD
jgi:hypothetical protein